LGELKRWHFFEAIFWILLTNLVKKMLLSNDNSDKKIHFFAGFLYILLFYKSIYPCHPGKDLSSANFASGFSRIKARIKARMIITI
jgi:hypothetical protein